MPSQYSISGHYRPDSETPFGWRFACGPICLDFTTCLLGIRRLITSSSGTKTAQEILDEPQRLMRACVSEHSLARILKAIFIPNTGLYMHALNITSHQDLVCLPIDTEKCVLKFIV